MTANMAGAPMGDLPWLEARRGGHRVWVEDTTVGDARSRSFDPARISTVSSDREDDFEALKQAALLGVKGSHRAHTVVLPGQQGESVQVVDLKKLDRATQRSLMERMMRGGDEGDGSNMPLLRRMAQRLERVGMQPPTVTVRYQHLNVLSRMTVGDRSLPTLKKTVKRRAEPALRALGHGPQKAMFPIIDDASGIIRPGVFTILLGPPGSGKSTFLQTLSGHNRRQRSLKFQAQELTFNGHQFQEFVVERSAAYISQNDLHYGELTVRETFDFAARCQATGYKQSLLEEVLAREQQAGITPDPEVDAYMRATSGPSKQNLIVEVITKLLGLDVCADTVVGNAMLRGISGGQKKRVTTGEMAVGPIRALFADEISTGLDSNTTFQIARAFKHFCHVQRATMVVGLLQPQPETFDEFDDVILLSNGRVCFHGPRELVLPFFEGQGFFCPPRRSIPDFLQEVTTPTDQGKYWDMRNGRPWHYVSALMIEGAFKRSEHWAGVAAELAAPFDRSAADPRALATDKYGQRYGWLLRTNFRRTLTLQRRNKVFAIIRTSQVLLMAFVVSTLFWREDKNTVQDGNYFFGVIFYSVLYMLLGAVSEMHLLVARLPVFYKQRDMNFYPGSCFAIPSFIMRVPWSFLEATIWTMLVYWIVGFSPSVRFLMWWLLLFLINLWSVALFQLIAAVCRDDTIATAVGSFFLLIFINLTGFVLNYSDIPGWWIWGYWANPFSWVTRALAINEFTSGHWMRPDPYNPSAFLGIEVLQFRGFPTEYWWCWAAVGFLLATMALCILAFIAACAYLGAPTVRRVLTPEALQEFELSRKALITPQPSMTEEAPQDAAERGAVAWPASPPGPSAGSKTSAVAAATDDAAGGAATGNGHGLPGSAGGYKGTLGEAGAAPGGAVAQDVTVIPAQGIEMSSFSIAATAGTSFNEEPPSPGRRAYLMRASQRISHASQQAEAYKQRTALPFTPAVVTFTNVEYSVPLPPDADRSRADVPSEGPHSGNLRLLKGIDGAFRPGVLTALMGASGAGKTTLMDVLAGRKTEGHITGDIRINGFPKDERTFARIMGYVEQTDIHIAQTTVAEALAFSAHLRLPTTVDATTRHAFVEEIMALVELTRLRHAYVGMPGVSGLSVEQRKRLTLAVELVANPAVVFMDEPTSGLDARAAGIVMDAVRATVDTGRTVVCTIHQPSIDIFEAFDELLLLKPGGATIYFGPLGDDSQRLIDYFQSIKNVPPCPERHNPANWMLEVTNPGSEAALDLDFAETYRASGLAKEMAGVVQQHVEPRPGTEPLQMSSLAAPGFRDQLLTNLRRNFIIYNRAPEYNITRAVTTILVAFCFGTMFWRQGDNRTTVAGVLNIMGVLFSSTLFLGISNCLTIQHLVAAQRTVFYRERAAGLYSVYAFSLAQLLVEVPYLLVQTTVYVSMVYWMVWFARDAGKFFWFFWYFFLTLSYFTTLGIAAVNMTPSVPLSNVVCSFFFGFWNLLSGFLIPIPAMPGYWVWAAWINPVMWSIYAMSISQLGSFSNEYITNLQGVTQTIPAFLSDHFQFETYMTGIITAILWAYILAFSGLACFALAKLNFQRR